MCFYDGHPSCTNKLLVCSFVFTLQELAETASKMEGMDSESAERMGEEIMQKMLKELSDMGNKVLIYF